MERDPAKAIQLLDLVTEFFDDGRRWLQGNLHDDNGNRCLIGAVDWLRWTNAITNDGAGDYLRGAIPPYANRSLAAFNDHSQSYDEIRDLIAHARTMAEADLRRIASHVSPVFTVKALEVVEAI